MTIPPPAHAPSDGAPTASDPSPTDLRAIDPGPDEPTADSERATDRQAIDQRTIDPATTDQRAADEQATDQRAVDPATTDQRAAAAGAAAAGAGGSGAPGGGGTDTGHRGSDLATPPGGSRLPALRRLGGLAVVAVLAGGSGAAVATVWDEDPVVVPSAAATGEPSAEARSVVLDGGRLDVAGVVDAVGPAVATIRTDVGGRLAGAGAGTGVVVSEGGEVLTNAHVVEGASRIHVTLAGESQSRTATLVGADAAADLALLRIDASDLDVAVLGSSASLAVGDDVVAIGNALALRGGPTVTRGIVSALDRSVDTGAGSMTGLIQTDASISSGNSGGPLVDAAGEVVGINTAVAASGGGTAAENIGFAIPVDQAPPILERLRDGTQAAEAGYLGVDVADPTDGSRGAVLTAIAPGGPADDAGLRPADLVTSIDGTPVDGAAALAGAVRTRTPGAAVEVAFARGGQERQVTAILSAASSS